MPKRTSNASKTLAGSPNARPVTVAEPLRRVPSGLDAIGKKEWQRIRKAFSASGRLTSLDESLLMLYCSSYSRWRKAEAALLEQGEVILVPVHDTHGKKTHDKPIVNPLVKVAEAAARTMQKAGEALGLSPASRVKQGVELKADEYHGKGIFELLRKEKKSNETAS